MTNGSTFAVSAFIVALLGLVLVTVGVLSHDYRLCASAGVAELAAVVFALLSLRDR